jgi:hypothetical protein
VCICQQRRAGNRRRDYFRKNQEMRTSNKFQLYMSNQSKSLNTNIFSHQLDRNNEKDFITFQEYLHYLKECIFGGGGEELLIFKAILYFSRFSHDVCI